MRNAKIPVKVENYAGKVHSKSIIIDDKYIVAGSMNFSNSGENRNDEKGTEKSAGNVAGSDRILQLATKLMFLYAKSEEQIARDSTLLGNRQIKIAYQRNGESDCAPINLQFDSKTISMKEV